MADISKINPNGTEYDIKDAVARGMVEGSKTATGNPITLTDASESYAEELEVELEPIQSGSGTPSPSNIRPITGYTDVNVTTADASTSPTVEHTTLTHLGRTVYGGKLNVKTGELTVTHGFVDLGSLSWNASGSTPNVFNTNITDKKAGHSNNVLCSAYSFIPNLNALTQLTDNSFGENGNNTVLYFKNTSYTDAASFKTAMSGVYLAYELATPQTYQLTPQELKLLKQYNYITTNGTTISLKYQPDNVIGEAIGVSEEYTDRHFAWKKVGEYNSGDLVTIDGEWSEILLTTYTSINNGYNMSVVYPFALFGVASLTAFNEANGEITLNSTLLNTKYVSMTGLSGAKMHVYVR